MDEREEGEWSGDKAWEADVIQRAQVDDPRSGTPSERVPMTQLRLVKLASDVLPKEQTVAIIDADVECVSIGRDRAFTPRVRLPAMEVSKHHANIFPIKEPRKTVFAISDTGSTHGTYVSSRASTAHPLHGNEVESLPALDEYDRLSLAKQASAPRRLEHLHLVRIGQTIFQVHLHASSWATSCEVCALKEDGTNEIHLLAKANSSSVTNQVAVPSIGNMTESSGDRKIDREKARRQAMRELKTQHLAGPREANQDTRSYVDRAAERRSRFGNGTVHETRDRADAAQMPATRGSPLVPHGTKRTASPEPAPARLDDASNRGFKLYAAMTAARSAEGTSAAPSMVVARGVEGRAGLGSKQLVSIDELTSRERQGNPFSSTRLHPYNSEEVHARQRRRYDESHASLMDNQ